MALLGITLYVLGWRSRDPCTRLAVKPSASVVISWIQEQSYMGRHGWARIEADRLTTT